MFLERFRLDGKAALVTGGSRGLGLEAALALQEAGARVAVLARRARYLEEAKEALGEDALYLEGDVRDEARLEEVVEAVEATLGPLTILLDLRGAEDPR
jgi:NAD(P)-dependent dehydrogenase (short-subunit alcohol dehydrogenase family)